MFKREDLIAEARSYAKQMHAGQTDKTKVDYFVHVSAVAANVRMLGGKVEEIAAGYLHDVVEDVAGVNYTTLLQHGFPISVVRIVWALTKLPLEHQEDYMDRVLATEGAPRVKAGDLLHNLRADRLEKLPEYTQKRLKQKYQPFLARLLMELGYLQTLDEQEAKLATTPVGSSTWGTEYYSNVDTGYTDATSSKYYAPHALLPGDWPAGATAPIAENLGKKEDGRFLLEDDSEWDAGELVQVRVWPRKNWEARQALEKLKKKEWSPTQEWGTMVTKNKAGVLTIGTPKKKGK